MILFFVGFVVGLIGFLPLLSAYLWIQDKF